MFPIKATRKANAAEDLDGSYRTGSGLMLKEQWCDLILQGLKTWELRRKNCSKHGKFFLVKCGSKKVFGEAVLFEPKEVTWTELAANVDKHCVPMNDLKEMKYSKYLAWQLKDVVEYKDPVTVKHVACVFKTQVRQS